jgi:hypothetical protein
MNVKTDRVTRINPSCYRLGTIDRYSRSDEQRYRYTERLEKGGKSLHTPEIVFFFDDSFHVNRDE